MNGGSAGCVTGHDAGTSASWVGATSGVTTGVGDTWLCMERSADVVQDASRHARAATSTRRLRLFTARSLPKHDPLTTLHQVTTHGSRAGDVIERSQEIIPHHPHRHPGRDGRVAPATVRTVRQGRGDDPARQRCRASRGNGRSPPCRGMTPPQQQTRGSDTQKARCLTEGHRTPNAAPLPIARDRVRPGVRSNPLKSGTSPHCRTAAAPG